jgi:hypothetical protein
MALSFVCGLQPGSGSQAAWQQRATGQPSVFGASVDDEPASSPKSGEPNWILCGWGPAFVGL